MEPVIATESLTKKYKSKVVVNRLDLRVPGGSIYGFLGPNGAGKSTTLKMLLGLVKPTAGNACLLRTFKRKGKPSDHLHAEKSPGNRDPQGPADCTHERSAEQKSQPVFPWHETASRPGRRSSGKSEDPSSGRTHQRPGSCRHPGNAGTDLISSQSIRHYGPDLQSSSRRDRPDGHPCRHH